MHTLLPVLVVCFVLSLIITALGPYLFGGDGDGE